MHQSVPSKVAIVAMGASSKTYISLASNAGSRFKVADETWAINAMGSVIQHDLLFHMDDCKVQEARAGIDKAGNIAGLMEWLKTHPNFFTCKAYEEYKGAMVYPLQDVINSIGSTYLNGTVAYAVAYAIHIGVKQISLFGCDYSYADSHKAESGRGCVEFLLGMAAARGIRIEVAEDSSLLDANVPDEMKPYGFCDPYKVTFEQKDIGLQVKLEDKELPDPHEMERRYCHVSNS